MSGKRCTEEFKIEAVKQIRDRRYLVSDVAGRKQPQSVREKEDKRLLSLIKESCSESGHIYGYRKITDDLKDLGEVCGRNRVHQNILKN